MVLKKSNRTGLRTGFTTGACAAAASKAALIALLEQRRIERVELWLPVGENAVFTINDCSFTPDSGYCSVIKDAGDDPDVTDGIEIQASVSRSEQAGIFIRGGVGVGVVTKPGLEIPVGQSAINPVPRRMIISGLTDVLHNYPPEGGLEVVISAPRGEVLAKKTLNLRLGITGGISILGTTGIVIPYSREAYQACISQAIDVAAASGNRQVVLTTGRRSEKFAQNAISLAEECFVQAGDFIGFALQSSLQKGIKKVTIWGMIGKITKMATGHLYTNISDSEVDIDFLTNLVKESGIAPEWLIKPDEIVSANQFREAIPARYLGAIANRLCYQACLKCREYADHKMAVECILSDYNGKILGRADVTE